MCHINLRIMFKFVIFVNIFLTFSQVFCELTDYNDNEKWPTIMYCVLARNKQHTLPYFLTLLNRLDYPKDRIAISIHSDHNEDLTTSVLKTWFIKFEREYHNVDLRIDEDDDVYIDDETGPTHWPKSRFEHVISLRNNCLMRAKNIWADYLFMLDADVFLTDNLTLKHLVRKDLSIVSPMLKSDSLYSNFWCGMTSSYYYARTENYLPTLDRERIGCFDVPMIHSAVLINLRRVNSDKLTYDPDHLKNYNGPYDDIIAFAMAANSSGENLYICNDRNFGYIMTPLEQNDKLSSDSTNDIIILSIAEDTPIKYDDFYKEFISYPKPDKLGFDKIYMINLLRRPARRRKMEACFKELGIDAFYFNAVDGKELNGTAMKEMGISFLPDYLDPHEKRPMTSGEVGCFLSHYYIWKEMIEKNLETVMILEDDVRFEPNFRKRIQWIMKEVNDAKIDWDLIYLGRKPMDVSSESVASPRLVYAGYSYWTLAYVITKRGARKLLDAKPLDNLIPVDEFLPIMFDKHTNPMWKSFYKIRNLNALSANPLIVFPTHYTGQPGHFSDTEASKCVHEL